jgi:hypothetical protein
MIVEDRSDYDGKTVLNPVLEIKAPGGNCFIPFYPLVGWCSKIINCSSLKICCVNCPVQFSDLPDGIYEMKYSIDPNVYTIVEFSHFRTSSLHKQLTETMCSFFSKKCDYVRSEYKMLLDKLMEIKFTLDASKWKVEECLENQEGLDLYEKAKTLLNEFTTTGCNCNK